MDAMQQDGLVARLPNPADRRSTLITATEAGQALFNRMAPVLWIIAVLSTLTVIHRMRYTWTRTQDAPPGISAKAGQAA